MSYLKLCQISNDLYIEDCNGVVILENEIDYPLDLQCEIIDWVNEDEFLKRGKTISFQSVNISIDLSESLLSIREAVFNQLVIDYPLLNI